MPEPGERSLLEEVVGVVRKVRKLDRDVTADDIKDMARAGLTAANAFLDMEIRMKQRQQGEVAVGQAEDLAALKAKAAGVEQEAVGLRREVYSAAERRCPFLKVDIETEVKDEVETVDGVCDVRTQTFSDLPPFGPKSLELCRICIDAKDMTSREELAEAQMEITAQAMGAVQETDEDADSVPKGLNPAYR